MKENKINVYALRLNKEGMPCKGYFTEFEHTLKAMQDFVGGYIQIITLKPGIIVVCNDDGKLEKLPPNRALVIDGCIVDVFVGDIFVCRTDGSEMTSVKEPDVSVVEDMLIPIELMIGNQVLCRQEETLPEYKEL